MIALKILDENKFMAGFLKGSMLDHYQLVEGTITTFCTFSIDGLWQDDFFNHENVPHEEGEESRQFTPWEDVKEFCFSIIKGKRKPLAFKFVFFYPSEKVEELLLHYGIHLKAEDEFGLCINLRFDVNGLVMTSGVSKKVFSLDKSVDQAWDSYLRSFLKHYLIASQEL